MNTTTPRRRTAVARVVGRVAVVGVLALAGVAGLVSPANASPGEIDVDVTCTSGSMVITPRAAVQNGYFDGQYVTYRYFLENNYGFKGASGWAGATLVPYASTSWGSALQYGTGPLPQARVPAATGAYWNIYVQLAYWSPTAYSWSYTGWYTPSMVTTLSARYNYRAPHATCIT